MGEESGESAPLLAGGDGAAKPTLRQRIAASLTKDNVYRVGLLVFVILIGAVNRVTFKIMQYGTINYGYFISQFTTFMYLPINFAVIFIKMCCTKQITPEQRRFPKYKFLIMGALDSLQGLLIVVGGLKVPGIMQNLLLQGAVPVTMAFSILMLRQRESDTCREVRALLNKHKVRFAVTNIYPEKFSAASPCYVAVGGERRWDVEQLRGFAEAGKLEATLGSGKGMPPPAPGAPRVMMYTDRPRWCEHFKGFYRPAQYVGALIIIAGLVVSVWPALVGGGASGGAGPALWDLIFFSATVPTAVSAVYKQIAFDDIDLDVWYLNGWVALFQFLIGLLYAPLAAVMTSLPVDQIPQNFAQGSQCFLLGTNFITPLNSNCSIVPTCDSLAVGCCDSCNGLYPGVSAMPAIGGVLMYITANIIYNIVMILVIKKFDAAMMYVASTVVLPLGSVCFTIQAFLGAHAKAFTVYDGVGLGVVLLGLIIYRFLFAGKVKTGAATSTGGYLAEPILVPSGEPPMPIKPRTGHQIRGAYYSKVLGAGGAAGAAAALSGSHSIQGPTQARPVPARPTGSASHSHAFSRAHPSEPSPSVQELDRVQAPPRGGAGGAGGAAGGSGYQRFDDDETEDV